MLLIEDNAIKTTKHTYAHLHLHIPWQVRVNRQAENRIVGLLIACREKVSAFSLFLRYCVTL